MFSFPIIQTIISELCLYIAADEDPQVETSCLMITDDKYDVMIVH